MTQFLDKTGLQYYTTKLKKYIQAQTTTGISKSEADKTYVAKTDLTEATTSKAGLMSADDKEAMHELIEKKTDQYGDYYVLKEGAVNGKYYNISHFDGFISVDESDIIGGSSNTMSQDMVLFNKTNNAFISKTLSGSYYSNIKNAIYQGTITLKGVIPFTDHYYINDGNTYIYDGTTLTDIYNYINTTDIDDMFK